jgi:hypothetical protein
MVYVLAEVFIPDNYLGHESMRRHESMRIRHNGSDFFSNFQNNLWLSEGKYSAINQKKGKNLKSNSNNRKWNLPTHFM